MVFLSMACISAAVTRYISKLLFIISPQRRGDCREKTRGVLFSDERAENKTQPAPQELIDMCQDICQNEDRHRKNI
jgi:hypothetical protein